MTLVECETLFGGKKQIPRENFVFRPGAYAIIVHEGKVLLLTNRETGKYALPGGGIEIGEKIEDTLRREVQEEAGIKVEVERFAHFEEYFFYVDPIDAALHMFLVFYFCKPLTFDLAKDDDVIDEGDEKPRWVEIASLKENLFQSQGKILMELLQT
jgi:8-oxo-dGTP pyrophosphatase MutT (NUDIX family)